MTVSSIDSTSIYQTSSTSQTSTSNTTLGKEDFLKLFMAQLKAQDPLSPMDSTGFTAQLAQFSSLEQLTNINTQLGDVLSSQSSLQNTMATDLIGKNIKANGNTVSLNGQANMYYSLDANATKVTVTISDASGAIVKQQDVSNQSAGEQDFVWDGKDNNGNTLSQGTYTFTVSAVDGSGNAVNASTLTSGTVTSISFSGNSTYLTIDGTTQIQLGDIQEIGGA